MSKAVNACVKEEQTIDFFENYISGRVIRFTCCYQLLPFLYLIMALLVKKTRFIRLRYKYAWLYINKR